MAIIKYPFRSPAYAGWRDFDEPFNRLARALDEGRFGSIADGLWSPAVSVEETAEELVVTAELPGLAEEDIHVELENNVLSISGEKVEERKEGDEKRKVHVYERSYGSFRRSFSLPRTVNGDAVSAAFSDGVLTVTLPKEPEAKGRRIAVSTS